MKSKNYQLMKILMVLAIFIAGNVKLSGQDVKDLYELDLTALMNMEIVSASKKAENLFDAPLGASVITGDEIKRSGATSIMEALRLLPGVIVRETTPGNYDIHVRGYDALDPNAFITLTANTITLIMVNGRPIYNDYMGQTFWELLQIGINDVDKIELVRGPSSAMYGPNAVAGVINIITKKPANAKEGFSAGTFTQGGMFGTIISSTTLGYKMNNGFSVKASGNVDMRQRHWSDYYIFSKKQYTLTKPTRYIAINDFIEDLNDSIANLSGGLVRDPDKPANSPLNMKERFPDEELALDKIGGNLHLNYNKNGLDVNLMGGYAKAETQKIWANNRITALTTDKYDEMNVHLWGTYKGLSASVDNSAGSLQILGSGKTLTADWSIMNANTEYEINLFNKSLDIKPGVSFRASSFYGLSLGSTKLNTGDPTNYVVEEDEGYITNAAISPFLRTEYRYKKLRLISAVRADMFAAPKLTQISPLFAVTYKVNDDFLIRGSYGKAARTPMAQDLFMKIDLGPYPLPANTLPPYAKRGYQSLHYRGTERAEDLPNNKDLEYKLLTIEAVEMGFRHRVTKNFTIDFDLFGSRLSNLITNFVIDSKTEYNPTDSTLHVHYYPSYINLDAQPYQIGATVAITSMPFEKMLFQIFFTAQETEMTKYYDALDAKGNAIDGTDANENKYKSWFHTATPNFFGGINVNYELTKKINYNLNAYFYGRQTLTVNGINTREVRPNVVLNTNISYEIKKGIKVFANARNIAGSGIRQYAFGDKISWMALGGVNINL